MTGGGPQNVPTVILTFDDADDSIYSEALAYMETKPNMKGTFYCKTSSVVGGANQMTWEQVQALDAAGWAVCNHTRDHLRQTDITDPEIVTDVTNGKNDLIANGVGTNANHLAYPYGSYSARTIAACQSAGAVSGRAVKGSTYPLFPFTSLMEIGGNFTFGDTVTLAAAQAWIDGLVSNNATGVALFHTIDPVASGSISWSIADFQALIDYIVAQGVRVLTMPEAYAEYGDWINYKF